MRIRPEWIGVDWGSSNLRCWAIAADGMILDEKKSDKGAGGLEKKTFEPALLELIEPWFCDQGGKTPMPVFACGMVGSRQGWIEAPYGELPAKPLQNPVEAPMRDPRFKLFILPGICQRKPADVMRGEETQIAGFLAQKPDFDGVMCLPGTHSKWTRVYDGKIHNYTTAMTGEMFALLKNHSVLRHSLGNWSDEEFLKALHEAMAAPQNTLAGLFEIRAATVLENYGFGQARLSGLLIGCELCHTAPLWCEHPVVIIGADELIKFYVLALKALNKEVTMLEGNCMALKGLKQAYQEYSQCRAI